MPDLWIIINDTNILTDMDRIFDIIIPEDPNWTIMIKDKLVNFIRNQYLYMIV